jgi:GNAT superfamily N-acetyltransferase
VYDVFLASIIDLSQRLNVMGITNGSDPAVMAQLRARRRPLFDHLARTAEHFWIAEQAGQAVGYARSILREGVRELTEFFVLPGLQSAGVGRELLARAFPAEGARHRLIIATLDTRAQARYLKAGVYPRFSTTYVSRSPEARTWNSDLLIESMPATAETLTALGAIDRLVLGHRRDVEHEWLLMEREGYVYRRGGAVVGYGYLGVNPGPFALLAADDYPTVLAHAETQAAQRGAKEFGVEVPLINRAAVDYLLARGFQLDPFFTVVMMDKPVGKFENYLFTSPPFFV